MSESLGMKLNLDSNDRCFNEQHDKYIEGVTKVQNPVTKEYMCPVCYRMNENARLMQEATDDVKAYLADDKYRTLERESIIPDETLLEARFNTFICDEGSEERSNAFKMLEYAKGIIDGQTFNIVLNGTPGVGKSHLSYSLLQYVNENSNRTKSCLFVDVSKMFVLIRETFSNKQSKYTEGYFDKLLGEVDVLVMDDIGAEIGNIETDKKASDFIGRILRNITNSRQNKVTIFTTNLSSGDLKAIYDEKTVSRMFKKVKVVKFVETKDKRIMDLGF